MSKRAKKDKKEKLEKSDKAILFKSISHKRIKPNIVMNDAEQISFKAWFLNKLHSDKRLKKHHFEQLKLFMRGLGLKDIDSAKKYENALKIYFGK